MVQEREGVGGRGLGEAQGSRSEEMTRARRYCAEIGSKRPEREQVLVSKNQILSGCWQLLAAVPLKEP